MVFSLAMILAYGEDGMKVSAIRPPNSAAGSIADVCWAIVFWISSLALDSISAEEEAAEASGTT